MRAGLSHRRAIVVGAGQAGLAVAASLIACGMRPQQDFVVIDASRDGLRSWTSRWQSMRLLTQARHSALATRPLPGDPGAHPPAGQIAEYLDEVEQALGVKPLWGVRAVGVERRGYGSVLQLRTTEGEVQTRNIVCATGASSRPRMPTWAQYLHVSDVILHSSQYESPRQIPSGKVLVVGGGTSGVQLAGELSATHPVTLAVRPRLPHGHLCVFPANARYAPRASGRRPTLGNRYRELTAMGVTLAPAVVSAVGGEVIFADGSTFAPDSVVLATGYHSGDEWLPPEASRGRTRSGMTGLAGLFVAGIPAYADRGADTIAGVGRAANKIARAIAEGP